MRDEARAAEAVDASVFESGGGSPDAARASAMMTNIPGPRQTVYLAGAPLRGALVWAPCPDGLSLSVAIYSYNGQIGVGVATDAGLVPDPDEITAQLEPELDALAAHAGPA